MRVESGIVSRNVVRILNSDFFLVRVYVVFIRSAGFIASAEASIIIMHFE